MQAFERKCEDLLGHLISNAGDNPDPRHRYVSRNVEWDGRVPQLRQVHFENEIGGADPIKRSTLRDALRFYKKNRIDKYNPSAFDRRWNGVNEIMPSSHPLWCGQPESLGTIVNLSWYTGMFLQARRDRNPLFFDFPPPASDPAAETAWFEQKFSTQSDSARTDFLEQAFSVILEHHRKNGSKPVWVGEWDRIAVLLDLPSVEWLRFVGCEPAVGYPQLIVALRYGAKDGMPPLFRPTQLESGDNHRHFPLPGASEPAIGGFALNLSTPSNGAAKDYSCTREWIHSPFQWRGAFFAAANFKWGWTSASASVSDIAVQRLRHNRYVREKLPDDHSNWMPEPI